MLINCKTNIFPQMKIQKKIVLNFCFIQIRQNNKKPNKKRYTAVGDISRENLS